MTSPINPMVRTEYENIINTDVSHKNILVVNNGHFSKLTWGGRIYRSFLNLFSSEKNYFADCKAKYVAAEVIKFIRNNTNDLSSQEKQNLKKVADTILDNYEAKHPNEPKIFRALDAADAVSERQAQIGSMPSARKKLGDIGQRMPKK